MQNNKPKWEATQTVGNILAKAREAKNYSQQKIADLTNIRVYFIEMLEADHFDKLPSKIHINGFISVYARCVDVDPNDILLHLEKQEMLGQDTPMKEIFSITQDNFFKDHKKKIKISLYSIIGVVLAIFMLKIMFFGSSSSNRTSDLTDENPSITVPMKIGDQTSFVVGDQLFKYTLLDFNDQTIVLRYEPNNERFYILNNEVLKHDFKVNYEYDYQIKKEKISGQTLYLTIQKIKDLRTDQQAVFSTFLDNSAQNISKEKIVLFNKATVPVSLFTINIDNREEELTIQPGAEISLQLLKGGKQYLKMVYISDLSSLNVSINGQVIRKELAKKGMVGYISINFVSPEDISTMTYYLYF